MPNPSTIAAAEQADPLATLAAETAQTLVWTHHSQWAETIRQALERVAMESAGRERQGCFEACEAVAFKHLAAPRCSEVASQCQSAILARRSP